jgi:hypothetical protein
MNVQITPRKVVWGIATVLGSLFLVPIIQSGVSKFAEKRGYDQLINDQLESAMSRLAEFTQSGPFVSVLTLSVGGALALSFDWLYRRWVLRQAGRSLPTTLTPPRNFAIEINNKDPKIFNGQKWLKFAVKNQSDKALYCRTYVADLKREGENSSISKASDRMWLYASDFGDGHDIPDGSNKPVLIQPGASRLFDLANTVEDKNELSVSSTTFETFAKLNKNKNASRYRPGTYIFRIGVDGGKDSSGPNELTDVTIRYEGGNHIVVLGSVPVRGG